jgi:hypothetical protein
MTMKSPLPLHRTLLGAAGLVTLAATATADFGVSLRSTVNAGTDTLEYRLFDVTAAGTATANRLPSGTAFWLVFDTAGDGVPPFGSLPGTKFNINSILGPDDVAYPTTLSAAGRIARSITPLPDTLRMSLDPLEAQYLLSKPAFGFLFDVVTANVPNDPADPDANFGLWSFGSLNIPSGGVGNAPARIYEPLYADTFSVTAVPEPGVTTLLAAGMLGVGALVRRALRHE